jgi:Ca2+-binding RTX toxin-like protein
MRIRAVVVGLIAMVLTTPLAAQAQEIEGTSGPDTIDGSPDGDTIATYGGDDYVRAYDGRDRVLAGRGDDTVYGGRGADELHGGDGTDHLVGGINVDVLVGGEGNDQLFGRGPGTHVGNTGDDHIEIAYPAGERTKVRCGGGDDVLIFNEPYDDVSIKGCETIEVVSAG